MCGYFGNLHESPAVIDLLNQLNIPLPYPITQAYQRRIVPGLVTQKDGSYTCTDAMWWYALRKENDRLIPNEKLTSFNARDLDKPLWKNASKTRRAIVFATEIGESQGKDKYLMRSEEGFALGCLYKDWEDGKGNQVRSFAVITRAPHERFSKYHEKSTPFFLPLDKSVLQEWLDPSIESSVLIDELLDRPRLTSDLQVAKVKTYKNPTGFDSSALLTAD
ncbi:MAG: SOS response-associated peptidase family protein [Agarilytica sp.]